MSKLGQRLIASVEETRAQLRGEEPATYRTHIPVDARTLRTLYNWVYWLPVKHPQQAEARDELGKVLRATHPSPAP